MTDNYTADLVELAAQTFNCDKADIQPDMGPGDLAGWDSLGHVLLIEAIFEKYGDVIPLEEASEALSIASLAALLDKYAE